MKNSHLLSAQQLLHSVLSLVAPTTTLINLKLWQTRLQLLQRKVLTHQQYAVLLHQIKIQSAWFMRQPCIWVRLFHREKSNPFRLPEEITLPSVGFFTLELKLTTKYTQKHPFRTAQIALGSLQRDSGEGYPPLSTKTAKNTPKSVAKKQRKYPSKLAENS